jgi:steroid delta-isomerase-like uncharacterized protein
MRNARNAFTTLLVAVGLATTPACQGPPQSDADAARERNKALVRRWIEEGFNQKRLDVVDQLFADSFAVNRQVVGREGLKQSMSRHVRAFPDLRINIEDIVAEGAKVGIWYVAHGTHREEFEGIAPAGREVQWFGFDLFSIEDGKILNARFVSDHLGLLTQLGASLTLPGSTRR